MTDPTPTGPPPADLAEHAAHGRGRRRWLYAGVAGAAALAGIGLAWRKYSPGALAPGAEADFWPLVFATPEGGLLRMDALRGRSLLVNFWAPWCPPCVEELPLLNRFYAEQAGKGWQVLGLALDQAAPVQRFLAKTPVNFPVALAGAAGLDLGRSLGNASGALPFTVVLGPDGRLAHRKIGQLTPADLQAWAAQG